MAIKGATGSNLTFAQLEAVAGEGGFPKSMEPLMAAIALAESSGNPQSTNPTDNNGTQTSWGLWQISTGTHAEPAPNWYDPVENAKLAYGKWKSQGLRAWGTYDTGAYKRYLPSGYVAPDPSGINVATEGGQGVAGVSPTGNPQGSWTSFFGHAYSDLTGGLLSFPKEILGTFADIDQFAAKLFEDYKLFFQPSTYIRIGSGFFGFLFVIVGLVFLAREAKESAS